MTDRPIEAKSEFARVANLIAARQIMTWARGKPAPVRNAAAMLVAQLRCLAQAPHSAAVRAIVAASAERLGRS